MRRRERKENPLALSAPQSDAKGRVSKGGGAAHASIRRSAATRHERLVKPYALAVFVLALALTASACGRKGDVRPPPDAEDSPYPRAYPSVIER